jgi:thiamine kinase-like enzyme
MNASSEDRVRALPCWTGPVTLRRLSGGISNMSYVVEDGNAKFVARIGEDIPVHHVSRQREVIASRAAHAAGFSPEVIHAEPGAMVFTFIPARTYAETDVRANAAACVALIKQFHKALPRLVSGPPAIFWVFHVLRDYFARLEAAPHRHAANFTRWRAVTEALEAAQVPLPIVFGHHDLLPGNFLDDGRRLWLIDWEYGAFGTAMFDLANLAANNSFTEDDERGLLEAYFARPPDIALWRAFEAMKVASALREAVWAMVSELHLKVPGVDYVAYAAEHLGRLDALLAKYEAKHGRVR